MQGHIRSIIFSMIIALVVSVPVLAQDSDAATADNINLLDTCVENYDESVDYFPDKVDVQYAEGFTVDYENNYKVVTITRPWQSAERTFTYVLVQCGTPAPDDIEADAVIDVPVESIVTLSTTFLPHLDDQNMLDRVVGVDTLLYTNNEQILARQDELAMVSGGGSGSPLNLEVIVETDPDLVMGQQFSAEGDFLNMMAETDIPAVINSDFVDTSPLGQAEWNKYIALFFNTEATATETFDIVETQYNDMASLTDDIEDRPTVLTGSPFSGTWYMAAGDSYIAALIDDAGGDFLWADEDGTSLALDFEAVLERAQDADYWINANQFWTTAGDALSTDERFSEFDAFTEGRIWNNNRIQNENGGNAYYEEGVANPHVLLADLIAIFHPELLPDHEFEYYQTLEFDSSSE